MRLASSRMDTLSHQSLGRPTRAINQMRFAQRMQELLAQANLPVTRAGRQSSAARSHRQLPPLMHRQPPVLLLLTHPEAPPFQPLLACSIRQQGQLQQNPLCRYHHMRYQQESPSGRLQPQHTASPSPQICSNVQSGSPCRGRPQNPQRGDGRPRPIQAAICSTSQPAGGQICPRACPSWAAAVAQISWAYCPFQALGRSLQ